MTATRDFYERWVTAFYLRLLHGNFRGELLAEELSEGRTRLIESFRHCLAEVEPSVIEELLNQPEWRARLAGSWFAGLRGWVQFQEPIGALLLESKRCYCGQGYCAALACFANPASAEHLCKYLDDWLPQLDKCYDQHWAMPALVWVDRRLNTQQAARYLVADGPWDQWVDAQRSRGILFMHEYQSRFDLTLAAALAAFR